MIKGRQNVVSAVFNGNGAAASAPGNHSDRFTAVAAKSKEKAVKLFIVGKDIFYDIFDTFLGLQ